MLHAGIIQCYPYLPNQMSIPEFFLRSDDDDMSWLELSESWRWGGIIYHRWIITHNYDIYKNFSSVASSAKVNKVRKDHDNVVAIVTTFLHCRMKFWHMTMYLTIIRLISFQLLNNQNDSKNPKIETLDMVLLSAC